MADVFGVPIEVLQQAGPWAGWLLALSLVLKLRRASVLVSYYQLREASFYRHVDQLEEQKSELAQALQRAFTANAQQAETIRAWRIVARSEGWSDDSVKTVRFEPYQPFNPLALRETLNDPPPLPLVIDVDTSGDD